MEILRQLVRDSEDWLMSRILDYARRRDYTKYTSTLQEAWRMSISGLSQALLTAIATDDADLELGPDQDYVTDPAAAFGIFEAKIHRERGVSLSMFLGLMKYYRQTYVDLIWTAEASFEEKQRFIIVVERFFDRVEIAFCVEWIAYGEVAMITELQVSNRVMTNEKNKYLTIFESLPTPVIMVDAHLRVESLNPEAIRLINTPDKMGKQYYHRRMNAVNTPGGVEENEPLEKLFPWILRDITAFSETSEQMTTTERAVETSTGIKYFKLQFSRMLDVSAKFSGYIIILDDISERKQMENRLRKMATTDPLTGASNRRHFFDRAEKELERSQRYNAPLAVLMIDIDHFKEVNDSHGHDAGDAVLKELVKTCHALLRASDIFGRIGGEEFAAVLVQTDTISASRVSERLREALSALQIPTSSRSISITVSIGLAIPKSNDTDIDMVIKRADTALYEAKKAGKNRVVMR